MILVLFYLDAGHGGKDGGASANAIKEKDIVLKIVKKMQSLLKAFEDVKVVLSRESDVFLSLEQRTTQANKLNADCLVSVHINSATNISAKGFESYRYTNAGGSTIALQNVLHQEIVNAMGGGIQDRGKKSANFHMLRESKMKAILTENLFISNSSDANLLKSDDFLDKVAQGHVNGLQRFYGLKKISAPTPTPTPPTDGKLYKVQVGAFEDRKNAEGLEQDLLKNGHKPFLNYQDGMWKVQVGAFSERANADNLVKKLQQEGYRPFIKYE